MPDGETQDPGAATWSLNLPQFEGPLDLLLHLCQKHELDVLQIPVAFVTQKYLEYLAVMQLMQLDIAAEYLVMAATLVHIKSKMLLPAPPADQADEEDEEDAVDPREALIRRLLEYQKYKHAAEQLVSRGVAGRDVFPRGMNPQGPSASGLGGTAVGPELPPLAEVPLFALVEAFQRVVNRAEIKLSHDIVADRVSLSDRIAELSDILAKKPRLAFEEMFDGLASTFDIVVTFLALLEMTRLKMTRLLQSEPLGPLYIELATADPPSDARQDLAQDLAHDFAADREADAPPVASAEEAAHDATPRETRESPSDESPELPDEEPEPSDVPPEDEPS